MALDIQPLINALNTRSISSQNENSLQLKVGQQLDVKVGQISSDLNKITLEIAKQTLDVRSNLTAPLQSGQMLKLEVLQLSPTLVLKLVEPKLTESILNFTQLPGAKTTNPSDPSSVFASASGNKTPDSPMPLMARVIGIKDQSIQLELLSKPAGSKSATMEIAYNAEDPRVKPGQLITLEAASSNKHQTFKIISVESGIADFVKRFLPKNDSPTALVNQLVKDNVRLQTSETASMPLKQLVSDILRNLPEHKDLMQGSLLKNILSESGLFLEAKIASLITPSDPKQPAPAGLEAENVLFKDDLKAHLLKLIQTLKMETAGESEQTQSSSALEQLKNLLQKSENSLARIILDQLASVPKEDSPKQQWLIEIPFLNQNHADSVKIEINKDQHAKQEEHNQTWSVTVTLSPPNIGPIRCKIAYFDNTVNTHFFAEKPQTTALIQHHLDYLKQQLEQAGLKTGHIEASEGVVESLPNRLTSDSLLDEKA
ncbi:MAG: flagellar hook-length control protein FliK [Methylicorpusculum sp.]|uniref:flagellar hook-length control protein FliK n=1 Tax=Methylicorpusculum sp. TaxID=2713644 RepID=UPI00271EBE02|nr:flagellar hook-length control protein FliK [Methylicorpusculum sp.]MDO8938286.1 flagellar hook-length control protein FliK [Methylicorpusculum sp.]MDP2202136.1 flagellar hook-length control protein FliK [Methylicorpusculum sp.]